MLMPNVTCRLVLVSRVFRTVLGWASRLISITMRMPLRSLSSRRAAMPSILRSRTRSEIDLMSCALLT